MGYLDIDQFKWAIVNKDLTPEYYSGSGTQYPLFARKGTKVFVKDQFQNFFGKYCMVEHPHGYAYPKDLDGNYVLDYKARCYPESPFFQQGIFYELKTRYGTFCVAIETEREFSKQIWEKMPKKMYYLDNNGDHIEVTVEKLKKIMRCY